MKWYKRDPHRAIEGMMGLTLEEQGAYNCLIDHTYARDGVLPADSDLIKVMLGVHGHTCKALLKRLETKGKIRIEDGKIIANGVTQTLNEAEKFSRKTSAKPPENSGKRSAKFLKTEQKQQNEPTQPQPQPQPEKNKGNLSNPTFRESSDLFVSDTDHFVGADAPPPTRAKKVNGHQVKGTRLPPDWSPEVDDIAMGYSLGLSEEQARMEFERFKDYWHSIPGQRGIKLNWDATWRNWLRKAADDAGRRQIQNGKGH